MSETYPRPLEYYEQAFIEFSNADNNELEIKHCNGALVKYEGLTYRVCHYDDLLAEFKTYFKGYDLIYTETPLGLWSRMMQKHIVTDDENLVIDLYEGWNIYWKHQKQLYSDKSIYGEATESSWTHFERFVEKISSMSGTDIIQKAIDLDELTFIPIIALTIRRQFSDEEIFYRECLKIMIAEFPDHFGSDGNFDEVDLNPKQPGTEVYFIYQPDFDYDNFSLF